MDNKSTLQLEGRPHVVVKAAMEPETDSIVSEIELNGTGLECVSIMGAVIQNFAARLSVPPEKSETEAKRDEAIRVIAELSSYAMYLYSTQEERDDMVRCGLSPLAYHATKVDPKIRAQSDKPPIPGDTASLMASVYIDPKDDNVMTDLSFTGRYNDGADLITGFLQSFFQLLTENAPQPVADFIRGDLTKTCVQAIETAEYKGDPNNGSVIPIDRGNRLN